jgi:hypothetical protein
MQAVSGSLIKRHKLHNAAKKLLGAMVSLDSFNSFDLINQEVVSAKVSDDRQ